MTKPVVLTEIEASMVLSNLEAPLTSYLARDTADRYSRMAEAHLPPWGDDETEHLPTIDEIAACIRVRRGRR